MRIITGIFILLHGLVHLLYFGQSLRFFELQRGMIWPDNSLLLSKFLQVETLRIFTGILCLLASIGFIISGVGFIFKTNWWISSLTVSSILSAIIFLLFWDGQWHNLDDQGIYSILINILMLLSLFLFT